MKKVLAIAVAIMLFLGVSAYAQDEEQSKLFNFDVNFAAGYGAGLGEESDTFAQNSQYALVQADVLGIDLFDSTSGVGVEVPLGGDLQYTVWSLNRATIPGTDDRVYGGSDLKLLQSTDDGGAEANFDLRLVTGYRLANVGPGQLRFELYFIEEGKPISFAIAYGF